MATQAAWWQFRVLGPLEVTAGGRDVDVGGPQVRAVLARLLVAAGRTVSVAALVDELWDGRPPADAARTARTYVSRLRKALGPPDVVVTRPSGYALRVDPDAVDAARFERLAEAGRRAVRAGDWRAAHERLAAASDLWRGTAFAEFDGSPVVTAERERLDRLRLDAVEDRIEAALAIGPGDQLVGELQGLVRAHPVRERLWAQLMVALYRSGRQAEALAAFRGARSVLVDEYGVEPSPGLAEVHHRILNHDPTLRADAGRADAGRAAQPPPVPAQLPSGVDTFAGRRAALDHLDALLTRSVRPDRSAAVIAIVSGTAGVGKTALAVHWARRVGSRFPDGQLYVNLRGFDPAGPAVDPADAVRGFLDALGVPVERIPTGLAAQSALYRSLLAGKRVLVVLDNARDVEQVRPLLPGGASGLVVVTSRDQLNGLVVAEGAVPLTLDLLDRAEAGDLLAGRLGAARVDAEPGAVDAIVERCAQLPLALAVVAARAAMHPGFSLADLAGELCDTEGALDALDSGDAATDVRAVFSWSYRTLSTGAAALFRLLGLHPGPDVTAAAAASLAGTGVARVRARLTELTRAHLLTEPTPGRYTCHDLLRAYAGELVDADGDRHVASHRMVDHYLRSADAADRWLDPSRDPVDLPAQPPGVSPERPTDAEAALAWFGAEHPVLLAVLNRAAHAGFDAHAVCLARALTTFHHRRDLLHDWVASHVTAVAAADHLGDPAVRANAHRDLGRAYAALGRHADAYTHLTRALDLYGGSGALADRAHAYLYLGRLAAQRSHLDEAIGHGRRALDLYRAAGHRAGEARTLNAMGWQLSLLGEHAQTLALCERALPLLRATGDHDGEAHTWDTLGFAHHHLGRYADAVTCFEHALALFEELGDRYHQADISLHLGDSHHAGGDAAAARRAWTRAMRLHVELGHPDADRLRTRLRRLEPEQCRPRPALTATA